MNSFKPKIGRNGPKKYLSEFSFPYISLCCSVKLISLVTAYERWGAIYHLRLPKLETPYINSIQFMEVVPMVFFEKIILFLYAGKILIWRNVCNLRPKSDHFFTKFDSFESFWPNIQTRLWIFLIFGMEVVHMVLFEKIILYYMLGKF